MHPKQGSFGVQSGHLAMQTMLKDRTWFGSQGRSRPDSLWMTSDGAPASIHVHNKGALISKQYMFSEKVSGRLQSWTGLVQMLGVFGTGLVWSVIGPLGNESDAEGQAFVPKPRSQQAS